MRQHLSNEKTTIRGLLIVAVVFLMGCSARPANLVREGEVDVERVSAETAVVWLADVHVREQEAWVTGEVIRHKERPADRPGHVDVEVVQPGGSVVPMGDGILKPVQTAGGNSRRLAFNVTLSQQLLPGSTVRVVYHGQGRRHGQP